MLLRKAEREMEEAGWARKPAYIRAAGLPDVRRPPGALTTRVDV